MLKSKERQVLLQLFLAVWLIAQSLVGLAKQDSAQASANGVSAWVTSNPPYLAQLAKNVTTKNTIAPKIIEKVNLQNTDWCIPVEHPRYYDRNMKGRFDQFMQPTLNVIAQLTSIYKMQIVTPFTSRIVQQPAHGKIVSLRKERLDDLEGENAGFVRLFNKNGDWLFEKFKYIPNYDAFKLNPKKDIMGEDSVKFEVAVNGKKFTVSYLIKVSDMYNNHSCDTADEGDDYSRKTIPDTPQQIQFVLESQVGWVTRLPTRK